MDSRLLKRLAWWKSKHSHANSFLLISGVMDRSEAISLIKESIKRPMEEKAMSSSNESECGG
jgi:hypothetical protein